MWAPGVPGGGGGGGGGCGGVGGGGWGGWGGGVGEEDSRARHFRAPAGGAFSLPAAWLRSALMIRGGIQKEKRPELSHVSYSFSCSGFEFGFPCFGFECRVEASQNGFRAEYDTATRNKSSRYFDISPKLQHHLKDFCNNTRACCLTRD